MAIIQCPSCQGRVQMPEEMAGMRVVCPLCQATYQAPGATSSEASQPAAPGGEAIAEAPPEFRSSRSRNRRNRFAGLGLGDTLPEDVNIALPSGTGPSTDGAIAVQGPANAILIWTILMAACILIALCSGAGQRRELEFERPDTATHILGMLLISAYLLVVLRGAVHMRRLSSYGWAKAAAILTLPTSCVGLIIGVWALSTLSRSEVKQAFGR